MKIISVSLEDELVEEINSIQKEYGKGRSKLLRDAFRLLVDKDKEKLKGLVEGVLIVTHKEKSEELDRIKHDFNSVIKTQIHSHLENGDCMELFVLKGDSSIVKKMKENLEGSSKIKKVRLSIV